MYKIVYNGMYEYIIIKVCSKYDTTTNTTVFLIMHCVLFAANGLNNTPNSSRRVGGEVVFCPRALTGDVWLAACLPTAPWPCLPRLHRCSPHIHHAACFLHCRMLSSSMNAAQLPLSNCQPKLLIHHLLAAVSLCLCFEK